MGPRIRPDLFALWPIWAAFPAFGLAVLALGVQASDGSMLAVGLALLAINVGIVVDHAYFTSLSLDGAALVFRSHFGLRRDVVPIGSIQRIDAKRYPGSHSGGLSAPNLVVRGRTSTIRVNTKPYRLAELRALVQTLRGLNRAIELDEFWTAVIEGREPLGSAVPRSRW
jgi:hypothetical protein